VCEDGVYGGSFITFRYRWKGHQREVPLDLVRHQSPVVGV
jgi:hypothetical protein